MIFFDSKLSYAESHYNFDGLWSRLYRPWPTILADAPFEITPGQNFCLWLVVKNAHRFAGTLFLQKIHLQNPQGDRQVIVVDQNWKCEGSFHFIPFEFPLPQDWGEYQIWVEMLFVKSSGQTQKIWNCNYPHLLPLALRVERLSQEFLLPQGWYAGESHCHSHATSDQVEFGAHPQLFQDAARQLGMDFVIITDHSYDMEWDSSNYMSSLSGHQKFAEFRQMTHALNSDLKPTMIWGQEVSCANSQGRNVHLLVAGCPEFLLGQGDGGRRWFNNRPDRTIAQTLELSQGYPAFAAHPLAAIGRLEAAIFRRGSWSSRDLSHPDLCGSQFASGNWSVSALQGEKQWLDLQSQCPNLRPIGGSDAHGDLNVNYSMGIPLLKIKKSRLHQFGRMRTLVQSAGSTIPELLQSLRANKTVATNGPWLDLELTAQSVRLRAQQHPRAQLHGLELCLVHESGETSRLKRSVGGSHAEEIFSIPSAVRYVYGRAYDEKQGRAISSIFNC